MPSDPHIFFINLHHEILLIFIKRKWHHFCLVFVLALAGLYNSLRYGILPYWNLMGHGYQYLPPIVWCPILICISYTEQAFIGVILHTVGKLLWQCGRMQQPLIVISCQDTSMPNKYVKNTHTIWGAKFQCTGIRGSKFQCTASFGKHRPPPLNNDRPINTL